MAYKINETCIGCGICLAECPQHAIKDDDASVCLTIDPDKCNDCGQCITVCPTNSIESHV